MTRDDILNLAQRIARGHELTPDETRRLADDDTPLDDLIPAASALTRRVRGGQIEFCSIVNARSGRCPNDCAFCAQSAHFDTAAPIYDLLDVDEIVAAARDAAASGACRFSLVTSGPAVDDGADFDRICQTIYKLAGLELCSGGIFGLGETWEDRLDMAAALRELTVDAVALNFLVPIPGTPLEHQQTLHADEALRIIALYRFIFPRAAIKLCGGREAVLRDRQPDMFAAGADGAIIGNYLTTPGRPPADDLDMAAALGLHVRRPEQEQT